MEFPDQLRPGFFVHGVIWLLKYGVVCGLSRIRLTDLVLLLLDCYQNSPTVLDLFFTLLGKILFYDNQLQKMVSYSMQYAMPCNHTFVSSIHKCQEKLDTQDL